MDSFSPMNHLVHYALQLPGEPELVPAEPGTALRLIAGIAGATFRLGRMGAEQ